MLKAYGDGVVAELDELRTSLQKVTDAQLLGLPSEYREMV